MLFGILVTFVLTSRSFMLVASEATSFLRFYLVSSVFMLWIGNFVKIGSDVENWKVFVFLASESLSG